MGELTTKGARIIEEAFEPGDGTRYELALVVTVGVRNSLLVWNNAPGGGKAMRVARDASPAVDYIAEKMGIRLRDAAVMFRWLMSVNEALVVNALNAKGKE